MGTSCKLGVPVGWVYDWVGGPTAMMNGIYHCLSFKHGNSFFFYLHRLMAFHLSAFAGSSR